MLLFAILTYSDQGMLNMYVWSVSCCSSGYVKFLTCGCLRMRTAVPGAAAWWTQSWRCCVWVSSLCSVSSRQISLTSTLPCQLNWLSPSTTACWSRWGKRINQNSSKVRLDQLNLEDFILLIKGIVHPNIRFLLSCHSKLFLLKIFWRIFQLFWGE